MIILLIAGLKPYAPFGGDINIKVDLSNYTIKIHFKKVAGVDISNLVAKYGLQSLKVQIDFD